MTSHPERRLRSVQAERAKDDAPISSAPPRSSDAVNENSCTVQATATSPEQAAWARYHSLGLRTDDPVGIMNAFLDLAAAHHSLTTAVKRYVQTDPESTARILAFGALVRQLV